MSARGLSMAANAIRIEAIRQAVAALPKHVAIYHSSFVERALLDEGSTAEQVSAYIAAVEREKDAKAAALPPRAQPAKVIAPAQSGTRSAASAPSGGIRQAGASGPAPSVYAHPPIPKSAEALRLERIENLQRSITYVGHDDLFVEARADSRIAAEDIALRVLTRERNNVPAAKLLPRPPTRTFTRSDVVQLAMANWEISGEIRAQYRCDRNAYILALAGPGW